MKKARHLLIASMVLMLLLLTRVSALASITVTVIPNIPKVDANTGSTHQYSNHWQYWSQGASAYPDNTSSGLRNMRRFGCRVVAQSKLLVEAGLASSDVSVFNPDIYFAWAAQNGYQNYSPYENAPIGAGVIAWGKSKGTTITMTSESYTGNPTQVMNYINAGKYVIMGCSAHQAYIGRAASLSFGEPVVLDSGSWTSSNPSLTKYLRGYDNAKFDTIYIYTVGQLPGYLGVNGWLDGAEQSTLGEYGTFDMYINGSLKSDDNDINDYYAAHPQNTPYEIKDIKAKPGYDYLGVKSGSLKGNTSGALTMVVLSFSRQGNLVVSGQLDGVLDRSIEGYGTFDVYLDGKLDESGCTSYNKHLPNGTKYEVKNITAQTNKNYGGLTSLTGVVRSGNESSVVLAFTTDGTATTDWQVAKALPENLDRDTLDIEYKFNYVTKARTSPGDGWEMIEQGALQYENDGERYMLDTEKDTSDTCELVGYFYFHYCNYGTNANYYWKDYLPVRHTISMEYANSSFTVKEMGTDGDGSGRKYYYLTHTTGEYNGNIAKCSGNGSQVYYRGGVYQNKKTYRINTYSKTTDWSSTYDDAAAIASVRWRLKQYSVTFAPMGGTFDAETMTKYNGIDLFLPTNVPTYELHEFVAWNTMPDGSGDSYPAGGVYTVNEDVTLYAQWKEMGVMNLPKDVTVIEAQAFAGSSAAVVSIHDGCTKIGSKAFANCPNLCRIYIPASVTDIALDAFEGCPNLVIYAPAGSVAIRVAKYNDIPFNEE